MPAPVQKPRTLYDKIWDDHVVSGNLIACFGIPLSILLPSPALPKKMIWP